MKILALNGSHKRSGGMNEYFLEKLFRGARAEGAVCETIRLANYKIMPCTACDFCQRQDSYSCIYDEKDDFLTILESLKEADLVIYATPVYIFQMSARLKLFFDRFYARGKISQVEFSRSGLFFHDVERDLLSKPFVPLIVSDNAEKETTANLKSYFKSFSRFMDAPMVGELVRQNGFLFRAETKNKKILKAREEVLAAIEAAGRQLARKGSLDRKMERKVAASVLPIPSLLLGLIKKSPKGRAKILQRVESFKASLIHTPG